MTTLDELKAKVTDEQGIILNTIWRHFAQAEDQNGSWIRAGVLYHRLGKGQNEQTVHATLAPLGGTVVYETTDTGTGRHYGLTFLGMLLTEQGREIESMMAKALGRIRDLFLENPSGRMNVKEIAKDIGLNEAQSSLLLRVFPLSGFFSGGGSLESAGWPREIDDLVHVDDFEAYIREGAMQGYDPSVPVDSDPVSRSLYSAAIERYPQLISTNDQFGRVPLTGSSQVGRESVLKMHIESSGDYSVAARDIINSKIYIGTDTGSSAEKRTPAQEFEYRSKQAMKRSLSTLTGTGHFYSPPELEKIEEQFRAGSPVLLSGEAGSGKSAIGGRLAEAAFNDRKGVLLLDARKVAHIKDEMALRGYFGSSNPLSEVIREIGRACGFRLIIDQMDNLIGSSAADLLIDLALECKGVDGVDVIVISRSIEDHEVSLLQPLTKAGFIEIESQRLRDEDVVASLEQVGITDASPELVRLGQNLLNLEIIRDIKQQQPNFTFATISDEITLWDRYVGILREREGVGGGGEDADQLISTSMNLARRCLMAPTMSVVFDGPLQSAESRLKQWNIIIGEEEFVYRFKHEKFQDYLYSRLMCGRGNMPDVVLAEIDRYRTRTILLLMHAKYKADKSKRLPQFLRETLLPAEIPFFAQTAVLDQYIHPVFSAEDVDAIKVIIEVLHKNLELRKWFFSNHPHQFWASILLATGFLDEAPSPVEFPNGYQLKRWDAQEYLISVAAYVPEVVVDHFERLKGHPYYFERAIYALRQIPMREANKAMPSLLKKLADPEFAHAVGEEAFELMTAIAKEDIAETAFALFGALTVPQPSPKVWEYKSLPNVFFNAQPVALLPTEEYHHQRFWHPAVKELARLDIEKLDAELERLLLLTLRMEAETGNRGEEFETTSFWRNAIEETGQDHGEGYKDLLLELLRDNLDLLAVQKSAAAKQIVDHYLGHSVEILRRLGLYLLWRFPAQFSAQVKEELFYPENLNDSGIHHEYFILLQHGYSQLDPTDKERLEKMIMAGPGAEELEKVAAWANKEHGEDPEAYARGYCKHWVQKRLWMMREHLVGEAAADLQRLTDELGEPDHPEFTHWISGTRAISSVSPISVGELREMTPESLIGYLRDWKPGVRDYSRGIEESFGALGRAVADAVLSDLGRYGEFIHEIARLHPAYAMGLINYSFNEAVEFDAVRHVQLSLIERLLADETIRRDMSSHDGTWWVAFRHSAVDYARRLMEREDWQIPADELPILRDILITLVDDPDPESKSDRAQEDWTEHSDPATVAINHVRPQALNVLINYACYVARREGGKDQKGFGAKRLEPSIEQTLTRKVDWRNDPSLSVHSIFGQCLNQLCWLDMEWVKTHLNDIFPEGKDDTSTAFFDIAWSSYVSSGQGVYAEVFGLLRDIYGRAIKRLKGRYQTKTHLNLAENFASHLIVEYLYADYDLHPVDGRQSLIVQFFNEMPSDVRRQAAWRLASVYQYNKKDEQLAVKLWQRTRALWQWRLDEAARMEFPIDFEGEMEGLSALLNVLPDQETIASMWPFLEGLLHYVTGIERHDRLWIHLEKYLSREVERDPVRAIHFYGLMHDRLEHPLLYYSDDARIILEVGAKKMESRRETLLLLERIAREGYYGFNSLYEKYAALSGRE